VFSVTLVQGVYDADVWMETADLSDRIDQQNLVVVSVASDLSGSVIGSYSSMVMIDLPEDMRIKWLCKSGYELVEFESGVCSFKSQVAN
jgi:hypothetical protein